jgi:Domain of unknown function (DUF2017)
MEMFRSTKDGGASVWLSAGEASLLRTLIVPVMELLGGSSEKPDGVIDELERLFGEQADMLDTPQTPQDPVLARLLPDAYPDDEEAASEFRKYTEPSLREAKKYFAQTMLDTLPPKGGRVRLTGDQARDWLRALNDIRLMLGVRLEVTEDFEEQLEALSPQDPRIAAFEVYGWLGAVQESLVQALDRAR